MSKHPWLPDEEKPTWPPAGRPSLAQRIGERAAYAFAAALHALVIVSPALLVLACVATLIYAIKP